MEKKGGSSRGRRPSKDGPKPASGGSSHSPRSGGGGGSHLPSNNEFHLLRKLWHVTGGLVLVVAYQLYLSYSQALLLFGGFLLVVTVVTPSS